VIKHPSFPVEPWVIRETALDLPVLDQIESVFALSNGHIGLRGNLDEGEPAGVPGTYLAGFYELRPLPYAEAGFGFPESGQTVVNVTNGKIMRLLVEDESLDVRYGTLHSHERVLDLRAGTLQRTLEWESPSGRRVRVGSTRLVSFTQRAIAAIRYEVQAISHPVTVVLQSELVANEALPVFEGDDPRVAAALTAPLQSELYDGEGTRAVLVHRTRTSELTVASAMDHVIEGPEGTEHFVESFEDIGRVTVTATIAPGEVLRIIKFVAYGWSASRSVPALRDQVGAALAAARRDGWDKLAADQVAYLHDFWERADIEIEGDIELQQAARFALFHVLQAGARAERRAIAAKGLTGPGYDGHAFWDTESFVLPVLSYTLPDATRDALLWRADILELARERAALLGLGGAAFPWRTIHGEECSAYWPAGTAAVHVSADIAAAVTGYLAATGDDDFERAAGLEILVETARLWRSLGHQGPDGSFRIDGVTGPDEYSALADNNVYTNLMAQRNLRAAADAATRHGREAVALGVDEEETASWREAAEKMRIPYDEALGVHPQADNFTQHALWDFEATGADQYPLLLHFPYFELYRRQVVKQADLVLAIQCCGESFSAEQKARDFDYYERITVRDSSLSACTQSIVAAEVGHMELAFDYLSEAALIDLHDLMHNTRDGLHIASLAGTWLAIVLGLGGMRPAVPLRFAPRLPTELTRLVFNVCVQGRRLRVEVTQESASYSLSDGGELELIHHGKAVKLKQRGRVTLPIPAAPRREPPSQPAGRVPAHRRPLAEKPRPR
jgi:alpha,alpha-trehalose phosphorylase